MPHEIHNGRMKDPRALSFSLLWRASKDPVCRYGRPTADRKKRRETATGGFEFLVSCFWSVRPRGLRPQEPARRSDEHEKERCSGSYRQTEWFLVIKDDSISERPS